MDFFPADDLRNNEIFLRLDRTCEAQPEKNWVPAYYFSICLPDGTKIGQCDLRIGHNDRLYIGGNIGYGIDEVYRGHHYAAKACELLFRQARKHQLDYVIITCDPLNKASSRTCELAGGQYLETAAIPEWHNMYEEGLRQVMVYRFNLNPIPVCYGQPDELNDWMRLVRRVSRNFPGLETEDGLEEHQQTVLKFMNKKQALCVKENGRIAGVLLFSRNRNMICCLAVSPEHRRKGIASALLKRALEELDRTRDITVSTFREGDEKGIAPRALYRKFGFRGDALTEEFGYPNQVFILCGKTCDGGKMETTSGIGVIVEKVDRGTSLADQLLSFVEHCSWEGVKEHIAQMLTSWDFSDWETMFAATVDGKIVGMASVLKTDYYPLPDIFPWVSCIFVSEAYRGHRISGELISCANRYLKEQGFERSYIPTEYSGLYEHYGYQYLREITNYGGGTDRLYVKEI